MGKKVGATTLSRSIAEANGASATDQSSEAAGEGLGNVKFLEPAAGGPKGLRLRTNMPFDAWVLMGRRLSRISNASPWWLGDWIIYGQHAYGERYKAALKVTSLDYQTLRNYAWVARAFPVSRRRDTLSFQHHAEVASLTEAEQDLWLYRAEKQHWSRGELRTHLAEGRSAESKSNSASSVELRIVVNRRQMRLWRRAAASRRQELSEWLIAVADDAAVAEGDDDEMSP